MNVSVFSSFVLFSGDVTQKLEKDRRIILKGIICRVSADATAVKFRGPIFGSKISFSFVRFRGFFSQSSLILCQVFVKCQNHVVKSSPKRTWSCDFDDHVTSSVTWLSQLRTGPGGVFPKTGSGRPLYR